MLARRRSRNRLRVCIFMLVGCALMCVRVFVARWKDDRAQTSSDLSSGSRRCAQRHGTPRRDRREAHRDATADNTVSDVEISAGCCRKRKTVGEKPAKIAQSPVLPFTVVAPSLLVSRRPLRSPPSRALAARPKRLGIGSARAETQLCRGGAGDTSVPSRVNWRWPVPSLTEPHTTVALAPSPPAHALPVRPCIRGDAEQSTCPAR